MKILNLYCGIGGNRKLWGDEHEVTAVEINPKIAKIYKELFPNDKVIVADAHQYLLDHYKEFDFIWSSPPCPTHSRMGRLAVFSPLTKSKAKYPDMKLYQEILLLRHYFNGGWIVENVTSFYEPLIQPQKIGRHFIWSNFKIGDYKTKRLGTSTRAKEREFLQKEFGYNLDKYSGVDKRLLLRNCVVPEMGLHILNCATPKN